MKTTKRKKAAAIEPPETLRTMLDDLGESVALTALSILNVSERLRHMEGALQMFLVGDPPVENPKRRRKAVRKPKVRAAKKTAKIVRKPRAAKPIVKKPDGAK